MRILILLLTPGVLLGGALEDGSPLADNFNLPFKVHQKLASHEEDQLRPKKYRDDDQDYTYYISELRFLGRTKTQSGPRNLFYVFYIRSASYRPEATSPPRGHAFLLCVTDDADIEFWARTGAMSDEIGLNRSVLTIAKYQLDLSSVEGWRYFTEVRPL